MSKVPSTEDSRVHKDIIEMVHKTTLKNPIQSTFYRAPLVKPRQRQRHHHTHHPPHAAAAVQQNLSLSVDGRLACEFQQRLKRFYITLLVRAHLPQEEDKRRR